jgi:hypothetical protein
MTFFAAAPNSMPRAALTCCLLSMLALFANTAWSAVGYVHEVSGEVAIRASAGPAKAIKAGDMFDPGATFRTAAIGNVLIKFEDGQLVLLRPNTTFRIDQYRYTARNPRAAESAMTLTEGAARFVVGVIGSTNHNNWRFAAGAASIEIWDADATVVVDPLTQAVHAVVAAGVVALQTQFGTRTVGAGQFSSFAPGRPPTPPLPIAAAPAALQAVVTALRAAEIPTNMPVVLASAARATAAVRAAQQAQAAAATKPGDAQLKAAAEDASRLAQAAIQLATAEAQSALQAALLSGALAPSPPSRRLSPDTPPPPTPPMAITPPPTGCTGSRC